MTDNEKQNEAPEVPSDSKAILPYAAAVIHFLDRDSQKIQIATMYPITRIELSEFDGESLRLATRVFIATDGKWVEVT